MPNRIHGYKPPSGEKNGQLMFAVIKFFQEIEIAQTFPGRNKYPSLVPWSKDQATRFLVASGKLRDTFWKIDRSAELLDERRRSFVAFEPPSATIDDIIANQQADRDIPLFIDCVLSYLKVFTDSLATVTRHLYPKRQVPFRNFREQMKWFIKKPGVDPAYTEILKNHTEWFQTLAGDATRDGLRDLTVHHMYRTQLFYQPGQTGEENKVHAFLHDGMSSTGSIIPSIQKVADGMFAFLDLYVNHFVPKVSQEIGAQLLDLSTDSCVLLEFPTDLPSSWLYPLI